MQQYALIGIFIAVAMFIGLIPFLLAYVLSPKKSNPRKSEIYESGIPTYGETWIEFKPQYYLYGLAFVVFDVEVVFLFPWALAFQQLGIFAVVEAILFLLILVFGLFYVWRKGWLEWV